MSTETGTDTFGRKFHYARLSCGKEMPRTLGEVAKHIEKCGNCFAYAITAFINEHKVYES